MGRCFCTLHQNDWPNRRKSIAEEPAGLDEVVVPSQLRFPAYVMRTCPVVAFQTYPLMIVKIGHSELYHVQKEILPQICWNQDSLWPIDE